MNQIPQQQQLINNQIRSDELLNIKVLTTPGEYTAYLYNTAQSYQLIDNNYVSYINLYFITENKQVFKLQLPGINYLYVYTSEENIPAIQLYLQSKQIQTEIVKRILTDQPNTNAGTKVTLIKASFQSSEFMRRFLNEVDFKPNKNHIASQIQNNIQVNQENFTKYIHTIFEHDLSPSLRTCIDKQIFVGKYYDIKVYNRTRFDIKQSETKAFAPELQIYAYDIETTKERLCFPNPEQGDQIMCISFQLNNHIGGLIINGEKFSKGVHDFSYHVDDEKYADYKIFYKNNEKETIEFFIETIIQTKPQIMVTFNGDSFDFNFIEKRANVYGLSLQNIGFKRLKTRGRFNNEKTQFTHNSIIHIDCYNWVQRDSYLPQGSQGLKKVTQVKLGYQPHELDAELMVPYAIQKPQMLAEYSVSDSLATYYLYKKLIHGFIFALCTIIPLNPDDVLRRGTGTLCESLLCVKASQVGVIYPDKCGFQQLSIVDLNKIDEETKQIEQMLNQKVQTVEEDLDTIQEKTNEQLSKRTFNQLNYETTKVLDSQTYTGGRVEAINSGLYRKDFEYVFAQHPDAYTGYSQLIEQLDQDLQYYIYTNCKKYIQIKQNKDIEDQYSQTHFDDFFPREETIQYIKEHVVNYDEVKQQIYEKLKTLEEKFHQPCKYKPIIYHLDVSSMYPNIILTNRLQPHAVVSDDICSACDFNFEENNCKRRMQWMWRGSVYPVSFAEYQMIQKQLINEMQQQGKIPSKLNLTGQHDIIVNKHINNEQILQQWNYILDNTDYLKLLKQRLEAFSQKNYHVKTQAIEKIKYNTICQRANSFYVDTVLSFRDRRYEFKKAQKQAGKLADAAHDKLQELRQNNANQDDIMKAQQEYQHCLNLVGYNESLQLAHKAILNSFYGYAMRTGSRWYSMEMAACVTYVGSNIIQNARKLVQRIGIPLELDTDGIWCMLPNEFPNIFMLKLDNGQKIKFEYPAAMLNAQTAKIFTNKQYQVRIGNTNTFQHYPENTIFFDIDGPYNAQFLSAAKEENKKIKKRYCVFDQDNQISELKGFELKRRGELQLIKQFQQKVFPLFLRGENITEAYKSAGKIANQYLSLVRETRDAKGNHISQISNNFLLQLLTEETTMKKALDQTSKTQKSAAITIAKRLTQYLDSSFSTQSNLLCQFIVSKYPLGEPVSQRVIPSNIFQCNREIQIQWLRKWTQIKQIDQLELLELLDWNYYYERFVNQLMKIIIVPSGVQGVENCIIEGVEYPEWIINNRLKQQRKNVDIENYLNELQEIDESEDDSQGDESEEEDNIEKIQIKKKMSKKEMKQEKEEEMNGIIDQVLQKYEIKINTQILDQLERISNKNVQRQDDAISWLEQQKRKWIEMYNKDQLSMSLRQIQIQESKNKSQSKNKVKHKIVSNNILSQISYRSNYTPIYVLTINQINEYQLQCFYIENQKIRSMIVSVPLKLYVVTTDQQKLIDVMQNVQEINIQQETETFISQTNQKLKNVIKLTVNRKFFKENKRFFQYQLSRQYIQQVYGLDSTMEEQFLLDCGAQNQIKRVGFNQNDTKFQTFEFYDNITQNYEQDTQIKKKQLLQYTQYLIYEKLGDDEVLIILNDDELKIVTTLTEILEDQFRNQHEQYIEYCNQVIETCQNDSQKRLLRQMLEKYKKVNFEIKYVKNTKLLQRFKEIAPRNYLFFVCQLEHMNIEQHNQSIFLPISLELHQLQLYQQIVEMIASVTQLLIFSDVGNVPIGYLLKENNISQLSKTLEVIYNRCLYENRYLVGNGSSERSNVRIKLEEYIQPQSSNRVSVEVRIQYFVAQLIQQSENIIRPVKQLTQQVQQNSMLLNELTDFLMDSSQKSYLFSVASSIMISYNQFLNQLKSLASTRNIKIIQFSPKKMILLSTKYNMSLAIDEITHIINYMFTETSEVYISHIYKSLQFKSNNEYLGVDIKGKVVTPNKPNFQGADSAILSISGCLMLISHQIHKKGLLSEQNDKDCQIIEQQAFEILKQHIFNLNPEIDASYECIVRIQQTYTLNSLLQDPVECFKYFNFICEILKQFENMNLQAQIMRNQIIELIHVNPEKFQENFTSFSFNLQCNHCLRSSNHELNWINSYNKCIFCQKIVDNYQLSQCIIDEIKTKIQYNEIIEFKGLKLQCLKLGLNDVVKVIDVLSEIY